MPGHKYSERAGKDFSDLKPNPFTVSQTNEQSHQLLLAGLLAYLLRHRVRLPFPFHDPEATFPAAADIASLEYVLA